MQNFFIEEIGSQPDLDFSDDNVVHLKKPPKKRNTEYSSTKVKARNLLTNISYRRYKESDFMNVNFIIDLLTFTLQYFNPIDIARKVNDEEEQKMISFIWEKCLPFDFAAEVYKPQNYAVLADPKLTYNKANAIVKKWLNDYKNKKEVCEIMRDTFKYIHYVFSSLFSKVYSRVNQFGIRNKSDFDRVFASYKMRTETSNHLRHILTTKSPENFIREKVHPEEQKPITNEIKIEPKLPTQKRKRERVVYSPEKYKKQKQELEQELQKNTEKLKAIKKARKTFQQKTLI